MGMTDDRHSKDDKAPERHDERSELMKAKPGHKLEKPEMMEPRRKK